jgi:hypothetical protein
VVALGAVGGQGGVVLARRPPVVAQVGDGLGAAAGQIQIGDGPPVQEGEGVGVALGERLTRPAGPLGAVATKNMRWSAIQPWSRSSSWL